MAIKILIAEIIVGCSVMSIFAILIMAYRRHSRLQAAALQFSPIDPAKVAANSLRLKHFAAHVPLLGENVLANSGLSYLVATITARSPAGFPVVILLWTTYQGEMQAAFNAELSGMEFNDNALVPPIQLLGNHKISVVNFGRGCYDLDLLPEKHGGLESIEPVMQITNQVLQHMRQAMPGVKDWRVVEYYF